MAKGTCVLPKGYARKKRISFAGAVHPVALVALFGFFLSGITYVYALNRSAMQGYAVRELEDEISELRKERKRLEIEAAERRSLTRIEESAEERGMLQAEASKVIEGRHSFALR